MVDPYLHGDAISTFFPYNLICNGDKILFGQWYLENLKYVKKKFVLLFVLIVFIHVNECLMYEQIVKLTLFRGRWKGAR